MTPATISLRVLSGMAERAAVFARMQEQRRAHIVQYNLPEPSLVTWMDYTAPSRAWICTLSVDGQEAATVWVTDFMGKVALYHFVIFRGFESLHRELCWKSCQWIFSGGLVCLMGIIPSFNRAALSAMRNSAWREIFRIPKACYVYRFARHVDGVLCYFTPELLREAAQ